ncbi:MAG: 16S rRNA (cytosine(1402)-N(4))-methyltransferase RsmH [Planctomycetota bacterium]
MANGDARREDVHVPVMLQEVLDVFRPVLAQRAGWFVDGTLGAGGHAAAILAAYPGAELLGIDQDPDALAAATHTLLPFRKRAHVVRGRHSSLARHVGEAGAEPVLGLLLDLGANSLHFDRPERGFSFDSDGPLDMRMDPTRERTAADIVNRWDEADLADLLFFEGDERQSRKIAKAIVEARRNVPFLRTRALADLIANVAGGRGRIHPATRSFQALRRAVNEEGEELNLALVGAESVLEDGGRLAVLTFHSGEDKAVKRALLEGKKRGVWKLEEPRPIAPSRLEVRTNPRARSARLRWAVRLERGEER